MALKNCRECGKEVSTKADKCPHCGAPVKKEVSLFTAVILIFIAIWLFVGIMEEPKVTKAKKTYSTKNNPRNIPKAKEPRLKRYVHANVNVRKGSGTGHEIVYKLKRGDVVDIGKVSKGWAEIYVNNVKKGFASSKLLKNNPIPNIEIIDFNWRTDPDFAGSGAVIWNVKLQNNTREYLDYIQVEFTTYDENGKLMDTAHSYVKGLSPGGSASEKSYATYFGNEKTAELRVIP